MNGRVAKLWLESQRCKAHFDSETRRWKQKVSAAYARGGSIEQRVADRDRVAMVVAEGRYKAAVDAWRDAYDTAIATIGCNGGE